MPTGLTPFPPLTVLWVALGGAIGSALRFGVAEWFRRSPTFAALPWSTLAVNVTGSLVLGAFAGWLLGGATLAPSLRAFVMIGILGGYTTFSTFAFEGLEMLQHGQLGRAVVYASASVILAIAAAAAGLALTQA